MRPPSPSASSAVTRNITIFDWDDTLFPSSSLLGLKSCTKLTLQEQSPTVIQQLLLIEEEAVACLQAALCNGIVLIITNSESGWVEKSAALFFPRVVPLLQRRVRVLSARKLFSKEMGCPLLWKKLAFASALEKVKNNDSKTLWSIVSVGDSWGDRESLNCVCNFLANSLPKSIKFLPSPSFEAMQSELKFLSRQLEGIYKNSSSIDAMVQIRQGEYFLLDISSVLSTPP